MGLEWVAETAETVLQATQPQRNLVFSLTGGFAIFVLGLLLGACGGCGWGLYISSNGGPIALSGKVLSRVSGHKFA